MRKYLPAIMLSLAAVLPLTAHAENALDAAMRTPASVFDMFLYRLNEETKCKRLLPNDAAQEPTLCMTGLRYSSNDNVLRLYFREHPHSEALKDFFAMSDLAREELLLRYIDRLSQRIGVVDQWGIIYSIPVTIGNSQSDIDHDGFRKALASQTEVHLNIELDGSIYSVSRLANGDKQFEIR